MIKSVKIFLLVVAIGCALILGCSTDSTKADDPDTAINGNGDDNVSDNQESQQGLPVIKELSASKPSPQPVGTEIVWTVTAVGDGLEYCWEVYQGEEKIFKGPWGNNKTFTWKPEQVDDDYKIRAEVRNEAGKVNISKRFRIE